MDANAEAILKQKADEYTKISLRMHFKLLRQLSEEVSKIGKELNIPEEELLDFRMGAQAEISAQTYIWTYLNLIVENHDMDILIRAWDSLQFRAKALVYAINFIADSCKVLSNQSPLIPLPEQSLKDMFREH